MIVRLLALIALAVLTQPSTAGAQTAIDACGQTVPRDATGALVADLDCTATPDAGVIVEAGATLDLGGHTLRRTDDGMFGVTCPKKCTVRNGAIEGGRVGIYAAKAVVLRDVTIAHTTAAAVLARDEKHVAIANGSIDAVGVVLHDNDWGFVAGKVRATDVTVIDGEGVGIWATRELRATDLVASGNIRGGVWAGKFRIDGLVATGNGIGSESVPPGGGGLIGGRGRISNGTITGNVHFGEAADLVTLRKPKLSATTCGRSDDFAQEGIQPWGVCVDD